MKNISAKNILGENFSHWVKIIFFSTLKVENNSELLKLFHVSGNNSQGKKEKNTQVFYHVRNQPDKCFQENVLKMCETK